MAAEKIKAKRITTAIRGGEEIYEVDAAKLYSTFTTEELKIATSQYLAGSWWKTIILSKSEMEVLTELWRQKRRKK